MVPVSITLNDPGLGFQGRSIFRNQMSKRVQERYKVTIEHKSKVIYDLSIKRRMGFQGRRTFSKANVIQNDAFYIRL